MIARTAELDSRRLFASQTGAAVLTIATGGFLWRTFHRGVFGHMEQVLAIGMLAAVLALLLQLIARAKMRRASSIRLPALQYPEAALLAVTVVAMAIARLV